MTVDHSITKPRLLVTRPRHQQQAFIQHSEALGFEAISLPCLDILPLHFEITLAELQAHELVLLTSRNAVDFVHRILPLPWPDTAVLAIGPATAHALQKLGQTLIRTPVAPYTSEAFLAWLSTRPVPASLAIVKGADGRQLIETTLRERGSRITPIAVYRRVMPVLNNADKHRVFVDSRPDVISVTSDNILRNLVEIAGPEYTAALFHLPIIVNSDRCAGLAARLGFKQAAIVAHQPGDAGQIEALRLWLMQTSVNR